MGNGKRPPARSAQVTRSGRVLNRRTAFTRGTDPASIVTPSHVPGREPRGSSLAGALVGRESHAALPNRDGRTPWVALLSEKYPPPNCSLNQSACGGMSS